MKRLCITLCLSAGILGCMKPANSRNVTFDDGCLAGCDAPPAIARDAVLPGLVQIAEIVAAPEAFSNRRVTITGCYRADPNHGAVLVNPGAERGILMLGGSDDIGNQPYDWLSQKVCGTFVGVVHWRSEIVPLQSLCPEVCFVSDGTVEGTVKLISE
jgi:hypothetical protein